MKNPKHKIKKLQIAKQQQKTEKPPGGSIDLAVPAHAALQHKKAHHKAPWLKAHQFKPGQSGNPTGKPLGAVSIVAKLKQKLSHGPTMNRVAQSMVDGAAVDKDPACMRILLDRIDGPVTQQVDQFITGLPNFNQGIQIVLPDNGRQPYVPNDPDNPVQIINPKPLAVDPTVPILPPAPAVPEKNTTDDAPPEYCQASAPAEPAQPATPPPRKMTLAELQAQRLIDEIDRNNAKARERRDIPPDAGTMGHGSHSPLGPAGSILGL